MSVAVLPFIAAFPFSLPGLPAWMRLPVRRRADCVDELIFDIEMIGLELLGAKAEVRAFLQRSEVAADIAGLAWLKLAKANIGSEHLDMARRIADRARETLPVVAGLRQGRYDAQAALESLQRRMERGRGHSRLHGLLIALVLSCCE